MKHLMIIPILFWTTTRIHAQGVGINTAGQSPHPSALLDLNDTGRGLLIPRMTTAERDNIASPADFLQIINTTTRCYETYNALNAIWETGQCLSFSCGGQLVDTRDAQSYPTVLIGSQCWMAANLNIGTPVAPSSNQSSGGDNQNTSIEKYCHGGVNLTQTTGDCSVHGGLYQWNEMMAYGAGPQGICPSGWHVPTDNEWKQMEMALGMSQAQADAQESFRTTTGEGNKLKTAGNGSPPMWASPSAGTNTSGFTALPSGHRDTSLYFNDLGTFATIWTATASDGSNGWRRILHYTSDGVYRTASHKDYGFSVRCVKN